MSLWQDILLISKKLMEIIWQNGGGRLLIPFIFWNIVYTAKNILFVEKIEWKSLFFDFFTGRSAAPLYYILVLIQLTILTPVVIRRKDERTPKWLYAVTPIYLTGVYAWTLLVGTPPKLYGTKL